MLVCKHCGKDLSKKLFGAFWVGGDAFCDKACAENHGYAECPRCGKIVTHINEVEGTYSMCDECLNEGLAGGSLIICHDCGKPMTKYDGRTVNYGGEKYRVCSRCSSRYKRCVGCGQTFKLDRIPGSSFRESKYVCPECKKLGDLCYQCGSYRLFDRLHMYKDNHQYCDACIGEVDYDWCTCNSYIKSYHTSHNECWDPIVAAGQYPRDRSNFVGYGFELETERMEGGAYLCDAIDKIREIDEGNYFFIERDGSLDKGFEMITRPFTMEAWPLVFDKASQIMNYLREHGYESGTEDCHAGLHFHVSKTLLNTEAQAKLLVFANHFSNELVEVSRRTPGSFSRWAQCQMIAEPQFYADVSNKSRKKLNYVIEHYVNSGCRPRHVAINLSNRRTVEFRFFKGTLVPEYLSAAFEFVNFMTELSLKTTPGNVYRMTGNSFKAKAKEYSEALGKYVTAAEKKELLAA